MLGLAFWGRAGSDGLIGPALKHGAVAVGNDLGSRNGQAARRA